MPPSRGKVGPGHWTYEIRSRDQDYGRTEAEKFVLQRRKAGSFAAMYDVQNRKAIFVAEDLPAHS
jgi:hypothetical protein